ncbi:MAG: rRNA maturation RNase YbeY [Gemmatimonadetes bacterium]|nr:rRNA maturation RNase YbeY [Gemmatimonadota bacterium]
MSARSRRPVGRRATQSVRGSAVRVDVSHDGLRGGLTHADVRAVTHAVLRAERVRRARFSITLVSDAVIRRLNVRHLDRAAITDVIAFGMSDVSGCIVGDVYVGVAEARRSAARHGVAVREELVRLVVHGVLHVLGYDHPDGDARVGSAMWKRQEALVGRLMRETRR